MKVPFKWLNDYVDLTGITPNELADRLNAVGVLVEHVENRNTGITNVVVGFIRAIEQHPNADRLRVCQVDVGGEALLQIVTGAPNVSQGVCVPVAVEGAHLAGGLVIKKSKLRGMESFGMMCSADELGISIKDLPTEQREGVLIFPPDTPRGASVLELLGIDEHVLHLEPFANRPDALSLVGIAREVSAALGRPLQTCPHDFTEADDDIPVKVKVDDLALCPRYTARVVVDVKVGPSPLWLSGRLQAAGLRSVNNVVDITNYVMLETGQPLHAFDLDRVEEARIEVRAARDGEKMVSIDGVERELDGRMLIIADAARPVAIAGVMGGLDSEVTAATTRVLLEAASFHPASVRRTSTRLALRSESSRRFEKGLDWYVVDHASQRAAHLLVTLCGGRVLRHRAEDGTEAPDPVHVGVRPRRVNHLLGTHIPEVRIVEILRALHFHITRETAERLEVLVPTYRPDVRREEDLIEEIARHYGYDNIPARLPYGATHAGRTNDADREMENLRDALVDLGMFEAITLSLLHPSSYEKLNITSTGDVKVVNPLVADQSQLRTTLIPHLLASVMHNLNARTESVALFELSNVYQWATDQPLPEEVHRLATVFAGTRGGKAVGFYDAKGVLEALFERLCLPVRVRADGPEGCPLPALYHPGKTGAVYVDGTFVGWLGALHPGVLEALDTTVEIVAAELDLDTVLAKRAERGWVQYRPVSRFPAVGRDLALVVSADLPSGRVEEEMRAAAGPSLTSLRCFDVYQGKQIAEGEKSLAYALTFQLADRTLTDQEIEQAMKAIVERVAQGFGARVRT